MKERSERGIPESDLDDIIDQAAKYRRDPDGGVAGKVVDKMKKRLENLGEVNPTAIEAFQEMKKRYEFILEQKMTWSARRKVCSCKPYRRWKLMANQQFLDTFNKVRENFQKVFQALFTEEDTADLVLENPADLAETGIDIVAKPKGKRPSSISQLSGGEKTLTATALLFSGSI